MATITIRGGRLLIALVATGAFAPTSIAQDAYNAGIILSPDEKLIAVASGANAVRLFRLADGKVVRTFTFEYSFFTKPSFSVDGKFLTAGNVGPDGGFNPVWRVKDGQCVAKIGLYSGPGEANQCGTIAFSGDGRYVIGWLYNMGSFDGLLAWSVSPFRHQYFIPPSYEPTRICAISPVGNMIARVLDNDDVQYVEFDGKQAERWTWPQDWPSGATYATFSKSGNVLVLAGDGWCASLDWRSLPKSGLITDTERGIDGRSKPRKSEVVKDFVVRSVAVDAAGQVAYLGSRDGRIAKFDLGTGKVLLTWKACPEPVKGLAVLKSGTLVSFDLRELKLWNPKGVLIKSIQ